ncbi:MAG TPA: hypothetical protein VG675_19455 [Bryobacteraceae bacterium]|nr:hypothetical protein [Bryobacteraceae bacterium]
MAVATTGSCSDWIYPISLSASRKFVSPVYRAGVGEPAAVGGPPGHIEIPVLDLWNGSSPLDARPWPKALPLEDSGASSVASRTIVKWNWLPLSGSQGPTQFASLDFGEIQIIVNDRQQRFHRCLCHRQIITLFKCEIGSSTKPVMPMMPLIGVRISALIDATNSLFSAAPCARFRSAMPVITPTSSVWLRSPTPGE